MATTVFRRGKAYTGQSKVDRGYTRPQISDLVAASGSVSQGAYGGSAPNITPTGPSLVGDTNTGKLWVYINSEWVFTGITLAL